jgi:hypothetical protein
MSKITGRSQYKNIVQNTFSKYGISLSPSLFHTITITNWGDIESSKAVLLYIASQNKNLANKLTLVKLIIEDIKNDIPNCTLYSSSSKKILHSLLDALQPYIADAL